MRGEKGPTRIKRDPYTRASVVLQLSETQIQGQILEYLERRHIFAWRNNTGRRGKISFGKLGSSDIIGVLPGGRFLAIEVKKPGEKPSPEQSAFLMQIARAGGVSLVAFCVEDVIEGLG